MAASGIPGLDVWHQVRGVAGFRLLAHGVNPASSHLSVLRSAAAYSASAPAAMAIIMSPRAIGLALFQRRDRIGISIKRKVTTASTALPANAAMTTTARGGPPSMR